MMRTKNLLLLTFLTFCIGLANREVNAQTVGNPTVTRYAERESGDKFTVAVKTRKGANVYATKTPSQETLNAIDKGLDDLFAVARKNNYRARLNHSYYSIYIARPDRTQDKDGNYSPGIAVNVGDYAGGIYDKGGYMYVAGMVFYLNPDAFLIVDYGKNTSSVAEIVRNEGEHIILYYNDRQLYNRTSNHGNFGGHPILN